MFTALAVPCSPKQYNTLPGVVEAHEAMQAETGRLGTVLSGGSLACRSTSFRHGEIGAFLLHKHWEVEADDCMIERRGKLPSGKPALTTAARKWSAGQRLAPSRLKVDAASKRLVALEFSSDPFVISAWRELSANQGFLDTVCGLIANTGLAEQVGFAIFDRASIKMAEGEQFVEENADNQSILSARCLTRNEEEIVIRTGWAFHSAAADEPTIASCIAYCMSAGSSPHCKHHHLRPMEMVATPPVCLPHD